MAVHHPAVVTMQQYVRFDFEQAFGDLQVVTPRNAVGEDEMLVNEWTVTSNRSIPRP